MIKSELNWGSYSSVNFTIAFQSTPCIKSFFPYNNPELFTEQIAGIAMDFTLVKLNDGLTIGK